MAKDTTISSLENLHVDLAELLEQKKLTPKSAGYISILDVDAEQLWVLRFYKENGILPTIQQAKGIWELHEKKKLTVKAFRQVMATSFVPKKIVFDYSDLAPFFEEYKAPDEIRQGTLKVLSNWKNKRNI